MNFITIAALIIAYHSPSILPHARARKTDETGKLQAQLSRTGYLRLPPGITYLSGLQVPLNGMIEGSGGEIRPEPGYTGPGIVCQNGGFHIDNVTMRGFTTGILVDSKHVDHADLNGTLNADAGTDEAMIVGCRIYNYTNAGIDWLGLSDGYISRCICANLLGKEGVWQQSVSPDPEFLPKYGATHIQTAVAGMILGIHAGGITVSQCHCWGDEWIDIADFAGDSYLLDNRLEGGRGAMLLLANYMIHVRGGSIWTIMGGNKSAAIMLGTHNGAAFGIHPHSGANSNVWSPGNCDVEGVYVNGDGFLHTLIINDDAGRGNVIHLIVPTGYRPTVEIYPHGPLGPNKLILTEQGYSNEVQDSGLK